MKILFVHQAFPGQFLHLAKSLSAHQGNQITALCIQKPQAKHIHLVAYKPKRRNAADIHPLVLDFETKVIRAEACAEAAFSLRQQGFIPDLIYAHPGWGESLFLKHIWPDVPLLTFQEFYYQAKGFDFDFDPEFQGNRLWDESASITTKMANCLLSLETSDWSICPTEFQKSSFPALHQDRISIVHDGIDTQRCAPLDENSREHVLELPNGTVIGESTPLVTFINRTLEPYRGAHTFIRSIPAILQSHPNCQVAIIGSREGVNYGSRCPDGEWGDRFFAEISGQYDPSQVQLLGRVSYPDLIRIYQRTNAHVYLTYPFVCSWSLLEAMSCACGIVGSRTGPVQEFIDDGIHGLLVDFFKPSDLAAAVSELLANPMQAKALGANARERILAHYDLRQCLSDQLAVMQLVAAGVLRKRT